MSNHYCWCFVIYSVSLLTGISNSNILISQRYEGDRLIFTCVLFSKDNLSQANWEKMQDSNRTNMGVFHPQHGIYIPPEQANRVKIEGKQKPHAYSSISIEKKALNSSEQICCVFVTFPSGFLRQCTNIGDNEELINTNTTKSIETLLHTLLFPQLRLPHSPFFLVHSLRVS